MRKIISTILIIATVTVLFSACNQASGEQTTAPLVTQSNIPTTQETLVPTDETIPSRTGITFSDIYSGTKSACEKNQIDDTISLLEPDGEAERFSFFMDTIGVVCKSENGYVVRATSICYEKSMLEAAYSTGSSGMLSLLQVLTIPILELDKNLEQTHFITQLLGAYKYKSDNINHSVLFIGDWLYSLSVPMSDEYIAVVAVYTGQQGNAEDSSAQVAAPVWGDYQPGQWSMFEYTNEWLNMKFYSNGGFKAEELFITPTIKYANASRSDAPNRPFVEMLFRWSNTENKGTPITLTIEPITDANKTLQEYADEKIQILQNSFIEFGLSCKYTEKQEDYVILFGEPYLRQYTTRNISGGIYKNYSYYSFKDNCLICLSFDAPSSLMNLDYFLSHFSALDGTGQELLKICTQCGLDDSIATFTSGTTVCDACIYQDQNGQYGEKKVCSKCGQSEPDAVFTEDWKAGDPCFGCLYNSQGGGSDEKLICSQCGADYTFRGLEEDGRCEDCRFGDSNSPNDSGNSGGNTSQQPASCSHNYANATCTTPQTCKSCGATTGSAAGHKWKSATCTYPETCSVCNHTQGDALGHNMGLTKCSRCDYTDYSPIAKSYSKVTAYDSKTGEDLEVTNVSVSSAGVLSFTFNGKTYSIALKERVYDSMTYFDCYQSGSKLSNAECRIGDASYYNMLHFEWDGIDGHRLYFCTEK